jgi:hypothetical protein
MAVFDHRSRYYLVPDAVYETAEGDHIAYKRRRFLPHGGAMPLLSLVTIAPGDRLDLIAARTLGDAEQFWQICDANDCLNPFDLTAEIGATLRVPIPGFQETES